jgi:hypothetical protein
VKRGGPLKRYTPLRAKSLARGVQRSRTIGNYKKRAWDLLSEIVRRQAADSAGYLFCVTCEAVMHWKEADAGHYHPRTDGNALFFDERNIHPQCTACNRFRRGNLTRYALYLTKTYGPTILEELDAKRRQFLKITESDYIDMIADYRERLKKTEQLPEAA